MTSIRLPSLRAALLVATSVIALLPTRANAASAAEINASARAALSRLLAQNPVAREVERHSSAVLVFPRITKGGFLIGAQHGEGALLLRNGHVVYFNTVAASYGLQAGIQQFGYALFFINGRAMEHLYSQGGWELGSAPSLVVVDKGIASSLSTTSLRKDIYAFFFDQKGLMGGMGLQGSKVANLSPLIRDGVNGKPQSDHTSPMAKQLILMRSQLLLSLLCIAVTATAAQPASHTKGTPTGRPSGPLKPGEYWWNPRVSPQGPVVILVSLPQQTLYAYRNGILVGRSSVSTGTKGHGTPTGVFTILEKKETHFSNLYQNAPMPNMQRLTWSGIAMHSGNLPGYPASHGCIRMPYDFSELLFKLTSRGGTVVIGDDTKPQPHFAANPGVLLAPKDLTPGMLRPLAHGEYQWQPERSAKGPITVLVSAADRSLYVYRNGEPIGRAAIEVSGRGSLRGHVFTLLDGVTGSASPWAPGRPGRKWMRVESDAAGRNVSLDDLGKRVRVSSEFAGKLYDVLSPGATIIVTDAPAVRHASRDFTILAD